MQKVLIDGIIYKLYQHGGISRSFTEKLNRLGKFHPDIEVLLHVSGFCRGEVPKADWIKKYSDLSLRPQALFQNVSNIPTKARIKLSRPTIFHSTYFTMPYWPGMRRVATAHDFNDENYPSLLGDTREYMEQRKKVIEDADAVIAVSKSTKADVLKYTNVKEDKIKVIYHGASSTLSRTSITEEDCRNFTIKRDIDPPYWLFVGTRRLYKNFGTLLRAFVRISRETAGSLVVAGGELRLEPWQIDLLIKNRLVDRVRLLQSVDDNELGVAYAGAAAFVFPSLAEGFGIPLLEAMACGAPIIASDIPVFREVAADSAKYFDPYNEEELALSMINMLDEETRNKSIEKGYKRVQKFSWDEAANRLGGVYKSLC